MTKLTNNIFFFLSALGENNNREWFSDHKKEYEQAKNEADAFFHSVYNKLSEKDHLGPIKIYRIYNDLRSAKDKPHLSPQESFVGGGFFNPEPKDLLRIRQEIAAEPEVFSQIMTSAPMIKYFWGQLFGDEVKTAPKGFSKDDPMIAYLRKKQFLLKRDFAPQAVLEEQFFEEVVASFLSMRPFYDFMTGALTTDLNGESLFD